MKSVAKKVKAFWVPYLYRRLETVGLRLDVQPFPAFAVAEAAHAVEQPVSAAVVRAVLVVNAPAGLAHVAPAVAAAADLHAALVGSALVLIHDAFVVVAAAAEQLHVAVVAVAVVLVLRRVHLVAVAVAQVWPHVQLAPHHDQLDAVRFAAVVAAVRHGEVHVVNSQRHVAPAQVELAEQQVVVTFAPLVVHRVRDVHRAPGTSVPSHDPVPYSHADP